MEQCNYVTIQLGEYLFGMDVAIVREVNRNTDITPVALSPDYVVGLINLRGQIISVLDPGIRLNLGKREIKPASRCVVLKSTALWSDQEIVEQKQNRTDDSIALLVDGVGDMITVNTNSIEQSPPNIDELDSRMISGVVKLENKLLILLKMREIVSN